MYKNKKYYQKIKNNIIIIQTNIRCYQKYKLYQLKLYIINKIKSFYKMLILRRRYLLMCSAVNYIKSKFLGKMIVRIKYKKLLKARKIIQGLGKGYLSRINVLITIKSIKLIKKIIINYIHYKKQKNLEFNSSIIIQKYYRLYNIKLKYFNIINIIKIRKKQFIANKIIRKIQSIWRRKLIKKRFFEIIASTIKIQSIIRKYIKYNNYKKILKLIIFLQSKIRKIKSINYVYNIIVNKMINKEFYLLNNLFKNEINNISIIKNSNRILGNGYLRDGITKFSKFLISFNLYFDLSFAYPKNWLITIFNFQEKLKNEKKNIIKIVLGSHHTVILDDSDCIYTMGLGDFGQLGHNNRNSLEYPYKIEKLNTYLVTSTTSSTGSGSSSSLSVGKAASVLNPVGRSLHMNVSVRDVCCGKDHTLLLSGESWRGLDREEFFLLLLLYYTVYSEVYRI